MSGLSQDAQDALRAACKQTSQVQVAALLGYSAPLVNQVLKGTYKGSLENVERAIRANLMHELRECEAFGEIKLSRCFELQAQLSALSSPTTARLRQTCPVCPHFKGAQQ